MAVNEDCLHEQSSGFAICDPSSTKSILTLIRVGHTVNSSMTMKGDSVQGYIWVAVSRSPMWSGRERKGQRNK